MRVPVTETQLAILRHLAKAPATASQLAEAIGRRPNTCALACEQMVTAEPQLVRWVSPVPGRYQGVITKGGRAALENFLLVPRHRHSPQQARAAWAALTEAGTAAAGARKLEISNEVMASRLALYRQLNDLDPLARPAFRMGAA